MKPPDSSASPFPVANPAQSEIQSVFRSFSEFATEKGSGGRIRRFMNSPGSLKNIGPAMAEKMIASGIDSTEYLKRIGAIKAYEMMYESGDRYGDFNAAYLLALEGAVRDRDWADLPEETRNELKEYAQRRQAGSRKKPAGSQIAGAEEHSK